MSGLGWQPHVPPWLLAALAAGALWWTLRLLRLLGPRWGAGSWTLVAPKLAALGLLTVALLDPTLPQSAPPQRRTLLVLIDQSGSMDLQEPGRAGTRRARAEAIVDALAVPAGVSVARRWFDTAVHDAGSAADQAQPPRGTDIAACLAQAARSVDSGACAGVLVLSDGGDEPPILEDAPAVPISVVGVGTDLAQAPDLALEDVRVPATAERGVAFTIDVEAAARGDASFVGAAGAVPLDLIPGAGAPPEAGHATLDLSHGRGHARFRVTPTAVGMARWTLRVGARPGEISTLDNQRELAVEVRERSLHVLAICRNLGLGFKPLRTELARDGGVSFTALVRTIGGQLASRTGERYTLQGDQAALAHTAEDGLPASAEALAPFDVVILGGSGGIGLGRPAQEALARWVAKGGGLAWEGGEGAFALDAQAPLAALSPWQVGADAPLERGVFPVSLAPGAQGHAVVQGLDRLLDSHCMVASLNRPGPLRAGAQALMDASDQSGAAALVAVQQVGAGKVLGIASDTLWRLDDGRAGDAYGTFWRQAVRWLADRGEGGQGLRVGWDKDSYRPGDTARARVRVSVVGNCRIAATLDGPAGVQDLAAAPAGADEPAWTLSAPLACRGSWRVRVVAYRDQAVLERYETVFDVAPGLPEGARLARDEAGLRRLAEDHGGVYAGEEDTAALAPWLASLGRAPASALARPLVGASPWWIAALAAALACEWILRRRRNLL